MKCEPCNKMDKVDKEYCDDYMDKRNKQINDWVGAYIKDDPFAGPLEPGMVGKYIMDPNAGTSVVVMAGRYNVDEDSYCLSSIGNENNVCRHYRDGKCILTGCDIMNMIKPCSCKSKAV